MDYELLQSSFQGILPRAEQMARRFYDRLFMERPELKPLFEHLDMRQQQRKLIVSLRFIVENLESDDVLTDYLCMLGCRHVVYGTEPEHYSAIGEVLLLTLAEFAGNGWTPEVARAWREAVRLVSRTMLAGASPIQQSVLTH